MPPQNPGERPIVDVSALGIRLANPMVHLLYALLATARSSLKPTPDSLMAVTPTMRSWNQFSAFIEEWEEVRRLAAQGRSVLFPKPRFLEQLDVE